MVPLTQDKGHAQHGHDEHANEDDIDCQWPKVHGPLPQMQPARAALTGDYRLDDAIVARSVGACRKSTPKENLSKCTRTSPCSVRAPLCSGALLRGDGREGKPALFYLVTAAMRAGGLFRVMLCHGQNLLEGFLAGVAEELIMGHTNLP